MVREPTDSPAGMGSQATWDLTSMPDRYEPPARLVSPRSLRLLSDCRRVLDERGVDPTLSLSHTCTSASVCWAGTPRSDSRPRLPWIGPLYDRGGAAVVGMNAPTSAGLFDETHVVEQSERPLALGVQRFFGENPVGGPSWFHYRAAVTAGLLLDLVEGRTPLIRAPQQSFSALVKSRVVV